MKYIPQSVAGEVSIGEMGSRVEGHGEKDSQNGYERLREPPSVASASENVAVGAPVPSARLYGKDIAYRPTSRENQAQFEALITHVHGLLLDESPEVIVSAAEAILEVIKSTEKSVSEKQKAVQELLSMRVSELEMTDLFKLCKEISDYGRVADMDERDGAEPLAVVFDDEDAETHGDNADIDDIDETKGSGGAFPAFEPEKESPVPSEPIVIKAAVEEETATLLLCALTKDFLYEKVSKLEPAMEPDRVWDVCKRVSKVILKLELGANDYEQQLMEIVEYKHLEFVKFCVQNRLRLHYWLRLLANRKKTIADMKEAGLSSFLVELGIEQPRKRPADVAGPSDGAESSSDVKTSEDAQTSAQEDTKRCKTDHLRTEMTSEPFHAREPRLIDLDGLVFEQGAHLMTQDKTVLPKGSFQEKKRLYDVITVPAPAAPPSLETAGESLFRISDMPEWAQAAFSAGETSTLNRVQSKVYPIAFESDENLLLCAPTGAGKTNVAMLAALRVLDQYRTETGFRRREFKIVYVAPLKALVAEQKREFERHLGAPYGITVSELTGDNTLSQREMAELQVLVTTPEKWDVVTRKLAEAPHVAAVRLLIVDEIHLLHDERGPVLESIIARAKRQKGLRLVGLSATLPNFEDVARFLCVDVDRGLFYFGPEYRPCPLEQRYMGVKETKPIKKVVAMNEACYDAVSRCRAQGHQVLVFVHSRKDTVKTAQWLHDRMEADETSAVRVLAGTQEILRQEAANVTNRSLAEVLSVGFGVHHAGLSRAEHSVVEDLFAQGHLRVLVCTATLAWGVNLPAHTVVIKGTDTYSPAKGAWVQLSPQDILQMLGRAGRPRYDVCGEGVIITAHDELQYYLAVLNLQLPIELQLMSRLASAVNAEVVLGAVASREDAVRWLAQTYLYVRMLRSPRLYQVGADHDVRADASMHWRRVDLAHSALTRLHELRLVDYDASLGCTAPTELGRVAAHFYLLPATAHMYHTRLRSWMLPIDVLQVFAHSDEFRYVPVRHEERLEVRKLAERCPVPVKEPPDDPRAKINVLLQLYVSKLRLEGFALNADMVYVTQSAARLMRAIHEICLHRRWAHLAKMSLDLCKYVQSRMWSTGSAFRQYGTLAPPELVRTTEQSPLPFASYFQLSAVQLAETINFRGRAQLAHDLLRQYPRLTVSAAAHPVSADMVHCLVELRPQWTWNRALHGAQERFLVLVADNDGEHVLHASNVSFTPANVRCGITLDFSVSAVHANAPAWFVTASSERWVHACWRAPIDLYHMTMPRAPAPLTNVLDVQSVPVAALGAQFAACFGFAHFNKFQSQCFHSLWNTNESVFVGASKACGKTTVAQLAVLNAWRQNVQRVVYLQPSPEQLERTHQQWARAFVGLTDPPKVVARLSGDVAADARVLALAHLVLATPAQFDAVTRRWRQRRLVQAVQLVVADDVHMVGSSACGAAYETVLLRLRFMAAHTGQAVRIVALLLPLLYGRELGEWLGCLKKHVYNFSPGQRARAIPEIRLVPYAANMVVAGPNRAEFRSFLESALVFVRDKAAAMDMAVELAKDVKDESEDASESATSENARKNARNDAKDASDPNKEPSEPADDCTNAGAAAGLEDPRLIPLVRRGVGLFLSSMLRRDQTIIERLFASGALKTLVASHDTCTYAPRAPRVVVYGTQSDVAGLPTDYYLSDIAEMVGCSDGSVAVYAAASMLEYYLHFLTHALPVESLLALHLCDVFVHEIAARVVALKQDCVDWLTYTFFYRRLAQNPSFYGLRDTSHLGVSEYLSELVESAVEDVERAGLIEIVDPEDNDSDKDQEEVLAPLNGAMIATHHNVLFDAMTHLRRLTGSARVRAILEAVTSSAEFAGLPCRAADEPLLARLAQSVPLKLPADADLALPHVKAFLLLQAHFSRVPLASDLAADQNRVLARVLPLVHAAVDSLASDGYLSALQAMDVSQMVVQGTWSTDTPLRQLPHVDSAMLARCKQHGVKTVYDVMTLDDDVRDDVLRLQGASLADVADFVNLYPNIDVLCEVDVGSDADSNDASVRLEVVVTLERDEEMTDLAVISARFSHAKTEGWWVVVGDAPTRLLYGVKRCTAGALTQQVRVDVIVPRGVTQLTVWCMCDSYVDADKETTLQLTASV